MFLPSTAGPLDSLIGLQAAQYRWDALRFCILHLGRRLTHWGALPFSLEVKRGWVERGVDKLLPCGAAEKSRADIVIGC